MAEVRFFPEDVGCQEIIDVLKNLKETDWGENTKAFFPSYLSYDKQTKIQQSKTTVYFLNLENHIQVGVIASAKLLSDRNKTAQSERIVGWSKHDYARMLHLRVDPAVASAWDSVMHPQIRRILDSRHSTSSPSVDGGSLADESNPWDTIAERFMDYEDTGYQNALIQYHTPIGSDYPIPKIPWVAESEEFQIMAAQCYDLNPNDRNRSSIVRSGAVLKEKWTDLKKWLHPIYADFYRSGNQNAIDIDSEWGSKKEQQRFCHHNTQNNRKYPQVTFYAYKILDMAHFEAIGKSLPRGTGRDNSFQHGDSVNSESGSGKKKQKRKRKNKLFVVDYHTEEEQLKMQFVTLGEMLLLER